MEELTSLTTTARKAHEGIKRLFCPRIWREEPHLRRFAAKVPLVENTNLIPNSPRRDAKNAKGRAQFVSLESSSAPLRLGVSSSRDIETLDSHGRYGCSECGLVLVSGSKKFLEGTPSGALAGSWTTRPSLKSRPERSSNISDS